MMIKSSKRPAVTRIEGWSLPVGHYQSAALAEASRTFDLAIRNSSRCNALSRLKTYMEVTRPSSVQQLQRERLLLPKRGPRLRRPRTL
eukprot:3828197-Pyramimonas_sp.AAC.1